MVATCSLAAGINLPARRVVLQGARMGRDLIGPAMLSVCVSYVLYVVLTSEAVRCVAEQAVKAKTKSARVMYVARRAISKKWRSC